MIDARKKLKRSDINQISPGDLIGLRDYNPDTGESVESLVFVPLPSGAFETTVPLGFIKPQKPPIKYTSDEKPVLFLGTIRMPPGTMFSTQKRTVFLHRFLLEDTVYYFTSTFSSKLEEMFYIIQRKRTESNV